MKWPSIPLRGALNLKLLTALRFLLPIDDVNLHRCNHTAAPDQLGISVNNSDCSPSSGCAVGDPDPRSWGQTFADAGGGVWATQFDVAGILYALLAPSHPGVLLMFFTSSTWFWSVCNRLSCRIPSTDLSWPHDSVLTYRRIFHLPLGPRHSIYLRGAHPPGLGWRFHAIFLTSSHPNS